MTEQKRKFTLGEVNTRMGAMGEVHFDQTLLDVLGIKPGEFIVFTISQDGVVTVTGEKKAVCSKPTPATPRVTGILPIDVTQPVLFDTGQPIQRPRQRRRTHS